MKTKQKKVPEDINHKLKNPIINKTRGMKIECKSEKSVMKNDHLFSQTVNFSVHDTRSLLGWEGREFDSWS